MPHSDAGSTAGVTAAALERVEAARVRADAAIAGEWIAYPGHDGAWDLCSKIEGVQIVLAQRPPWRHYAPESAATGAFIAHARADVPLLAAIAAAAVRLTRGCDPAWWGSWVGGRASSGTRAARCDWCGRIGPDTGEAEDIAHGPDCPAAALDAAIRAAGEAGT